MEVDVSVFPEYGKFQDISHYLIVLILVCPSSIVSFLFPWIFPCDLPPVCLSFFVSSFLPSVLLYFLFPPVISFITATFRSFLIFLCPLFFICISSFSCVSFFLPWFLVLYFFPSPMCFFFLPCALCFILSPMCPSLLITYLSFPFTAPCFLSSLYPFLPSFFLFFFNPFDLLVSYFQVFDDIIFKVCLD